MSEYQDIFKRIEIKYLLDETTYRRLRERLQPLAEVDRYGESSILNIYYDTPDYRLIRTSLEKPDYKEKLRLRSYNIPTKESPAFIEIKKKYDGVVYKRRIDMKYDEALRYLNEGAEAPKDSQIKREIDQMISYYKGLDPMMAISYDRIAMFGKEDPELRITFDRNIRYRTDRLDLRYGNVGKDILKPGERLMEVKIGSAFSLKLARIFSELRIYPVSFSKYGRGYVDMLAQSVGRNTLYIHDYSVAEKKGEVAYAG
ncbi:MAG: polyphosphate polymerase domain-containing protein [Eubacterium sp.]|nr:polyphosphate polymerase domain-containing protein [Eubacterium sp.]